MISLTNVRSLWALTALVAAVAFGTAVASADDPVKDDALTLSRELKCPICQTSLEQSNTQIAEQMKLVIRQKLEQGETPEQIKAYFVERYGESILTAPPKSGLTGLAWGIPGIAVLFGGGVVGLMLRRVRRTSGPVPPIDHQSSTEDQLLAERVELEVRASAGYD